MAGTLKQALLGILFASLVAGCTPPVTPTPTSPATPSLPQPQATLTSTTPPTAILPPVASWTPHPTNTLLPTWTNQPPTPTKILPTPTVQTATPNPLAGWHLYENPYLGYTIQYPAGASVQAAGFTGMPSDEKIPPGFTRSTYLDYLKQILPGNLCVTFTTNTGNITISPPPNSVGRFVSPCPGLGIGDQYHSENISQVFHIGDEQYTVSGKKLIVAATNKFKSEIFTFGLPNAFQITFISGPVEGMPEEIYQSGRNALLQSLSTLNWTRTPDLTIPGWTCAGPFTRLIPGMYAQVASSSASSNRVRAQPSISGEVIGQIYPGASFQVIAGPVCDNGFVFWQVSHPSIPGGTGWTAEGYGSEYYIDPYIPMYLPVLNN